MSLPRIRRSLLVGMPTSSSPMSFAEPEVRPFGGSRPSRAMEDWVFPEPDSPTMARTSPACTS